MLILASTLFLASSYQAADLNADPRLDKHVSFRTAVAPAEVALEGLANAAGVPIKAGGMMKREIFLFLLQDAPLRDAMVRLARASKGSWTVENNIYYLTRTPADDGRSLAQSRAEFVGAMKTELAKIAKEAAQQTPFTAETAAGLAKRYKAISEPKTAEGGPPKMIDFTEGAKLSSATPAGRLADKVIALLDAETIASTPPMKRTILSTSPTKEEAPLNLDLSNMVGNFVTEANTWADAIGEFSVEEQMRYLLQFRGQQDHVTETPTKVNVIINRDFVGILGVNIEVRIYGASGKMLGSTQRMVRLEDDAKILAAMTPDPKEAKLTLPPDELALISVMSKAMGGPSVKSLGISAELRTKLMHPDKFEPLAGSSSTFMLEAADAKDLNVVADLPDLFLLLGSASTRGGMPTATSYLNMMQALPPGTCPARLENGWLEIDGGTAPGGSMFIHRDDRVELARLFNSGDGTSLGTEPLARFAFVGGGGPTDFLWLTLTTVLCPVSEFEDANKWRMLSLLGSIFHHRSDAPIAAERIPFGALDPDSLQMVHDIVFCHDPRYISNNGQVFRAETEPAESLPNGLPTDGFVEVMMKNEDVVYTSGDHPQAITAATLAMYTAQKNQPGKFGNFEPTTSMADKFRAGSKRVVTLNIHLNGELSCNTNFDEDHIPSGDPVPFDQLPESFKAAVKTQLDLYEHQI